MIGILAILSVIGSYLLHAEVPSVSKPNQVEAIYFNAGTHTEYFNQQQVDTHGSTSKFAFAPTLGIGAQLPLKNQWRFLPELNWVLPKELDSRIIRNLFMVRGDFSYDPLEWLRLRIGTSVMILNQHGRGGHEEVSNGNTTSTFYYPNENRSSINNTLDLGAEYLHDQWALRLQTYTYALFKEERRQISYTLFVSYYWKQ